MPAFTFEKISPPVRSGSVKAVPKKPRGMLSQMIDRLAERRAKRALRDGHAPMRPNDKPSE
ncbi:hypothetical protein C2U70_32190 [Bradyrhizobium guangdongense]|uniref:hypothetical protein n=1 Tax=Bradyrhizobium guangdongense TaxID=1325090 RepID=UPI00112AA776|nr:hypothetical protein [Bradyrhizobium guangdongense]TPQ25703.1 hypothetical protein C2U70_32190 [Bradyrhizobium guangdongense]